MIDGLKQQFETVSSTVNSSDAISLESIKEVGGKIDKIETEIGSLSKRADSTADILKRQDASTAEFHKNQKNYFKKYNQLEMLQTKLQVIHQRK